MTVCTGNICRSPMAEVVLRERFEAAGLGDLVVVDSSGVSDEEHGNPVDRRARAVLAAHGYSTGDGHRARQVTPADLASRDLVLAMTAHHARRLRALAPGRVADTPVGAASEPAAGGVAGTASEIRMYRSFDPAAPAVPPGGSEHVLDVEDPWYGGHDDFETCLAEVEAAADGVVAFVRAELARTGRNPRLAEDATA
ncbi:low molecular weight phosphotyrosine protein phosphatase [Antribacter sp. KLBMP9083]|uniref:protein-tyrosine-phosphatase n=2 Tax=Antribacter soli TaxID=2910976 RepID=A0AA41QC91_9MICO|nr:low molecular weight protein-tyrosine-phosphatase [Antribacter soli]MCF4120476.1 low molecular weight phosphotyrosine protein phosphatase [Antribacter soli]